MKHCKTCSHWAPEKIGNTIGVCLKLSADKSFYSNVASDIQARDISETGIEAYPQCGHDGLAYDYTTRADFGCVHHNEQVEPEWKERTDQFNVRLTGFSESAMAYPKLIEYLQKDFEPNSGNILQTFMHNTKQRVVISRWQKKWAILSDFTYEIVE